MRWPLGNLAIRAREVGLRDAEHLPSPVNDASSQSDLLVAPDESWLILVVTDHAEGLRRR